VVLYIIFCGLLDYRVKHEKIVEIGKNILVQCGERYSKKLTD
jgi:hypothetical protein